VERLAQPAADRMIRRVVIISPFESAISTAFLLAKNDEVEIENTINIHVKISQIPILKVYL
jgi:hypothetical protein